MERKVVVPGEIIIEGDEYLPGEFTQKKDGKVVALKYGLAEEKNNLVKIISLSGVFVPKRGNVVIGKVENVLANGWLVDIGAADSTFLSIMEVPRYVNKDALEEVYDIDDILIAKIWSINKRGIDLSVKNRDMGKIKEGLLFDVNPQKIPRIIGREGSMIKLIKERTGCMIDVAHNGKVLVEGKSVEQELFAKDAILHVCENSYIKGLTDLITKWFDEKGKEFKVPALSKEENDE